MTTRDRGGRDHGRGDARRWTSGSLAPISLVLSGCLSTTAAVPASAPDTAASVQDNPAVARIFDAGGGAWEVLVDEDTTGLPAGSAGLGLSLRDPSSAWHPRGRIGAAAQATRIGAVTPAIGAATSGKAAYAVHVGKRTRGDGTGVGGLFVTAVDASGGTGQPSVIGPVALGAYGQGGPSTTTQWYEPSVAVTRHAVGPAIVDRVVVAANDVDDAPNPSQQSIFVWVWSGSPAQIATVPFAPAASPRIFAPGVGASPPSGRNDTLARPILRQDPRPGHACDERMAFLVLYPTRIGGAPCDPAGTPSCDAIAETRSTDCGDHWSAPTYILRREDGRTPATGVDGSSFGARQFDYAVGPDGSRYLAFLRDTGSGVEVRVKRAAPDASFAAPADTGVRVIGASAGIRRSTPSIAANASNVLVTYYEQATSLSYAGAIAPLSLTSWSPFSFASSSAPRCADGGLGAYAAFVSDENLIAPSFTAAWAAHTSAVCRTTAPSFDHVRSSVVTPPY